jgi:uncharacterized protein YqhQ
MRVGGQAIMEGVLMRSPNFWGMAVRTPAGDMDLRAERFRSITRKNRLFRLPILRGALSLGETLWLGMKALALSTNIALGEEENLSKKEIAITLVFGLGLAFLLFLAAPVLGTKGIGALLGDSIENPILFNLVEGVLRIGIFVVYLLGITLLSKDIKRFFGYHGAEHKAIKVYERGEELIPKNARKLDTSHVRCGTSFVLYVLVLSILAFSLLGVEGWLYMLLSRVFVKVIFEEFKGTGNMELRLDRKLANRRTYPAINIEDSSTRKEELLMDSAEAQRVWQVRSILNALDTGQKIELLIQKLKETRTNAEFLRELQRVRG